MIEKDVENMVSLLGILALPDIIRLCQEGRGEWKSYITNL